MKNFTSISIFIFAFAFYASAQKLDKQIDKIIAKAYPAEGPGGTFLIAKNEKTIFEKAYGKANIEWNQNNTTDSRYEIGSVTKQFTAAAILLLQEDGKLSVQDPISKYLPDYPTHGYTITIHHLLNHTSGIANYTDSPTWAKNWRKDLSPQELANLFKDEKMNFAPGKKWSYSNSGYILLGLIIEQVAGKSYADFLEERIFTPLNMTHTQLTDNSAIITNRALGYSPGKGGFVNKEFLGHGQAYAAGAISTTAYDLNLWGQALLNGTLLSQKSWQQMTTNYKLRNGEQTNYGYGVAINSFGKLKSIEHGGGIFGYTAHLILVPEEKLCVVGLTNRDGKSPEQVTVKLANIALNIDGNEPEPITLSTDQLKEYVGVYEFENKTTRTITIENGNLYSVRTGGSKYQIFPYAPDQFFFRGNETRLTFERNHLNKISAVKSTNRIKEETAQKTDRLPVIKEAITLDTKTLQKYQGEYELAPDFFLTIRVDGEHIFAKATNQGELEIYPLSKTRFFYKAVDAEIEFFSNEKGKVESLTLFQGGREMPAKKRL